MRQTCSPKVPILELVSWEASCQMPHPSLHCLRLGTSLLSHYSVAKCTRLCCLASRRTWTQTRIRPGVRVALSVYNCESSFVWRDRRSTLTPSRYEREEIGCGAVQVGDLLEAHPPRRCHCVLGLLIPPPVWELLKQICHTHLRIFATDEPLQEDLCIRQARLIQVLRLPSSPHGYISRTRCEDDPSGLTLWGDNFTSLTGVSGLPNSYLRVVRVIYDKKPWPGCLCAHILPP